MSERNDGLTEEEGRVADALTEAMNHYAKLPQEHPSELSDFVDGIHGLQHLLAIRIARRLYAEGWPTWRPPYGVIGG